MVQKCWVKNYRRTHSDSCTRNLRISRCPVSYLNPVPKLTRLIIPSVTLLSHERRHLGNLFESFLSQHLPMMCTMWIVRITNFVFESFLSQHLRMM
jgi:hypothetical protein